MKRPAAYYLLLLYCTVMLRCAIPVACDDLSHIFNEEAHIATIHAVYGNNHVEKEMATEANDNNKTPAGFKYEDQAPVHLFAKAFIIIFHPENNRQPYPGFRNYELADTCLSCPLPPPKFS